MKEDLDMQQGEILKKLKSLSNPQNVEGMARFGINPQNTLGIAIPALRKLAKEAGRDHRLSQKLCDSGIHEARILASLVDEPMLVTVVQMDKWICDFDSRDVCDQVCMNLFDKTPFAFEKAIEWVRKENEFEKRAGFALMACLAWHDKTSGDEKFLKFFPLIKQETTDERNFVKKAVNWALRQIGKRNIYLNKEAIKLARQIQNINSKSAKWIASGAMRELTKETVKSRVKDRPKVYVGTSGFNYSHWSGVFYPENLPQSKWLNYYSTKFSTVELNVTFYRLPQKAVFEKWRDETPKDFLFAIKGSRFITHVKKLKDADTATRLFFENASGLGDKLSVVLWQFGANFKKNYERLANFAKILAKNKLAVGVHQAFEFRHESWFANDVYEVLRHYNLSLCIAHSNVWPRVEILTASYVYLRFHGGKVLFTSNYSEKELLVWAEKARKWMRKGKDVYAYFNNDAMGYAPQNARSFVMLLV